MGGCGEDSAVCQESERQSYYILTGTASLAAKLIKIWGVLGRSAIRHAQNRPGGERGKGPPEGKFTKLGGKVNFGVLSLKLNVIRAKKGAISLFLTNKTSF